MSLVENVGNSESIEWMLKESQEEPHEKRVHRFIRKVANERMEFIKSYKEVHFLKDLDICLLFPGEFSSCAYHDQLIKKLSNYHPQSQEQFEDFIDWVRGLRSTVESIAKNLTKVEENFAANPRAITVETLDSGFHTLLVIAQDRRELNDYLDKVSKNYEQWTAEDWKNIQEIFEKKKLPFSHDFVQRCQRVALKTLAA